MKKNTHRLYEVEIKSMSLLREGKKSFITYFKGGPAKRIISNLRKLYPQYLNVDDKPMVNITPISYEEYEQRKGGKQIQHKGPMLEAEGNIVK